MKIWALGLIGLGWFANTLHTSGTSNDTASWIKHQAAQFTSSDTHNDSFLSALKPNSKHTAHKPIILAQEDTDAADSNAQGHSVQDALKWVLDKSQANLHSARSVSGMLPDNDPGITSRPALEQALRTQPATAAYPLAYALEHGVGGKSDYKRATHLYQQAAEQGDVRAQSRLGVAYMKGQIGLDKNFEHAEKWLTEAAIHNDLSAQYYLGRLLLKDKETNLIDALVWVAVAAKRGYEPAQSVIKEYWETLSSRQQDELLSRIRQWHIGDSSMSMA